MLEIRKSDERGHANHGWLKAKHSFSFADYYNPSQMGFRNLIVINQDIVSPTMGFPTHAHNDMEIITYIIKGSIRHKDNIGNDYVINQGELQVMSAGTGVRHSEFNASESEDLELLQIWIHTDKKNHEPSYFQKKYSVDEKLNTLKLVAGSHDSSSEVKIHQNVKMFATVLESDKAVKYTLNSYRYGWIQLISGELTVKSSASSKQLHLRPGDGLKIDPGAGSTDQLEITALEKAEFIFFDLN